MTPEAITHLFKEAYDTFPPLEGKPSDDDLLAIREALLPLLMVVPYDLLNGVHSLTAILTEAVKYEAEHGNAKFVRPSRLPLYDKNIADDATTVVRVRAEAAHKARLDDYASYEAAELESPNFSAMSSMRSGTTISKTPIPSTRRSRPSRSWPISTPTAGGCMPST